MAKHDHNGVTSTTTTTTTTTEANQQQENLQEATTDAQENESITSSTSMEGVEFPIITTTVIRQIPTQPVPLKSCWDSGAILSCFEKAIRSHDDTKIIHEVWAPEVAIEDQGEDQGDNNDDFDVPQHDIDRAKKQKQWVPKEVPLLPCAVDPVYALIHTNSSGGKINDNVEEEGEDVESS